MNKMSNQVCIGQLMFLYFILVFYSLSNVFHNFLNVYPLTKISCFKKKKFITIMYFMYFIVEDKKCHCRNVCNMYLHVREADSFVMMTDGVSPDISEYWQSQTSQTLLYMLQVFFSHPILSFVVFHHIPIFCLCHLYNNRIFSLTHVTYILCLSAMKHEIIFNVHRDFLRN